MFPSASKGGSEVLSTRWHSASWRKQHSIRVCRARCVPDARFNSGSNIKTLINTIYGWVHVETNKLSRAGGYIVILMIVS